LLNHDGLLILGAVAGVLKLRDIEPLGGTWLITRKVIAFEQDWRENRVCYIYSRIDDGHDSGASDVEPVLGIR
jgi:hypothetical protein